MRPLRAVTDSIGITWVCSTVALRHTDDEATAPDREVVRCVADEWTVHIAAPTAWQLTLSTDELRGRVEGAVRKHVERGIPLEVTRE